MKKNSPHQTTFEVEKKQSITVENQVYQKIGLNVGTLHPQQEAQRDNKFSRTFSICELCAVSALEFGTTDDLKRFKEKNKDPSALTGTQKE